MEIDIFQNEDGERAVKVPVGVFTFEDIHRAIFGGKTPEPRSLEERKEGIPRYSPLRRRGNRGARTHAGRVETFSGLSAFMG